VLGPIRAALRADTPASAAQTRAARGLVAAAVCLFALMLMWRPLLRGEAFLPLDALLHLQPWRYSYERVPVNNPDNLDPIRQTYPRRLVTNAAVRQGAWPLWNPSILSGTPLLNDGQLAFFYPPSLLFLVAPLPQAFGLYVLLHLVAAGLGAYACARRLKLGRGPALLAGTVYMFNGYLLTWLQLPHHVGATAMLPWCFWAIERALERGAPRRWALAGLLMALPLLCQIQLAFYVYVGLGCYTVARAAQAPGWPARLRIAAGFSLAVALALALSAVQLLPAVALSAQGQRSEIGTAPGVAETQFKLLLRLVLPGLDGTERVGPYSGWGPPQLQVPYPSVGLIPLALLLVAMLRTRHPQSWIFSLMAVLSFALAVSSPLLQLFLLLVPPYRQFEDHTRWFVLWGFAAALLAGMGAQSLDPRAPQAEPDRGAGRLDARRFNRLLLGGLALLLGGWSLWHLQLFTPQSRYGLYLTLIRQQPLAAPALLLAGGLLGAALLRARRIPAALAWAPLLLLIALDACWYGGSYNTSVPPSIARPTADLTRELAQIPGAAERNRTIYPLTRQIAFLQSQPGPFRISGSQPEVLPPNLAGAFGLEDIRAYHSLYFERYNRLARMIDGKDYRRTSEGSISLRLYFSSAYRHRRLLDMLNVAYIIFPPNSQDVERYQPLELVQRSDEGTIYRNPQVLPRAWLVHQVEVPGDDFAQLARMERADFDPAALALLDEPAPAVSPAVRPEPAPTVSYAPNQATVQAEADTPALLVLSDAYDPGWQVTLDGQPAKLYRANYALRGVWLPAGRHTVVFSYQPRSFQIGGLISLLTLLGLLACGLAAAWRARRLASVSEVQP
jgi:hypothetical protein